MLQLYPRNQIDFTWNGEPIRHTYDEHVVRDDGWYLSFKVLLNEEKEYKKLKKGMVVKGWTMDGEQAFRIWDITKGHGFLEVEALHLIYDLDTKMTNPVHVNNGPLNSALTQFKSGLPSEMGPFTFSTGISKQRTYNTENVDRANDKYNAMDVFMDGAHSIVGTWEAELLINNWDIRLVESVGSRTGALLYEKKNIAEFEDVESNKSVITRIYAQSTFTPEREEGLDSEPQEVHLSVVVESPLINDYEQVHEAIYINNDARTNQELSQWAMRKFTYEKVDLPERTIKVSTNIIDGTEIKYGDYLVLKYLTHDVEEEIRCVGYDVNPVTKDIYEINLGTNKLSMQGSIGGTVQDFTESQLNNEMAKVAERVTKAIMSSNGFNRIAYGPEPVPNPIEGDLWYEYQFDTPNTVTLKIWKDGMWVILLDDFMQERLKEKMEEIEQQAQGLADEIEASEGRATEKANQALQDAKEWAENLEDGLKIHASQITAGEIETARLKVTEIVSQGLSGNEESITQLVIGDDVFKSSVTNLTQQKVADELKQEYETIIAPVNVVNGEEFNNGETYSQGKYFYYNGDDRDTDNYLKTGVKHIIEITMPTTQNRGQSVSVRVRGSGETRWNLIGANFILPTGQYKVVYEFTSLVFADRFADYRVTIYDEGTPVTVVYSFKIYRNEEVQVPIEGPETGAISSQITQLYNMINLSILGKDGAMSRIAMGEEGIQIDGKLLHITAKTFIDDAVIKSAMIDTLDAGKITTGELNASLIRVINLDANSISGNEASFISALFSGSKSTLQITGSGVNVLDNAGRSATELGVYGMDFYRGGKHLGALEYATNVGESGDLSGYNGITFRPQPTSHFSVSYYMPVSERPAYSNTTTYSKGDIIRYISTAYISEVNSNRDNTPYSGSPYWRVYTGSTRVFSVNGRNGNMYMSRLIKPSEKEIYGIKLSWGTITGRGTNVRIYNHDMSGGIQIENGDIFYLSHDGWRSLNSWIR